MRKTLLFFLIFGVFLFFPILAFSQSESVFAYPFSPNISISVANLGSQNTSVSFTVFDGDGNKIREGSFELKRGTYIFKNSTEEPFLFEGTGIVVFASNVPLASEALEFDFDGSNWKEISKVFVPQKIDSRGGISKIGFVYIYSDDREPQIGFAERISDYRKFQQNLLDKELPRNGHNRVRLPYDLDENGSPRVIVINAGNREKYFDYLKNGFERIRWDLFFADIKNNIPSEWKKIVVFADMWIDRQIGGQNDDVVVGAQGDYSIISARYLPFLNDKYFGDKRQYRNIPIPEFDGKMMPFGGDYGKTFEDLADAAISLINHENGHAFWGLGHSDAGPNTKFASMMGHISQNGCLNPNRDIRCILLPIEANTISIGQISRPNEFEWISEDFSPPVVEILSKEIINSKLFLIFKAEDLESGVNSFSTETIYLSPWTLFWKPLEYLDDLENITVEIDSSGAFEDIYLRVINNQGIPNLIKLF